MSRAPLLPWASAQPGSILASIARTNDDIVRMLVAIDEIARHHDGIECGLPLHNEGQLALLILAVREVVAECEKAKKETP